MKKIVFATNNVNKLEEIRLILVNSFEVLGLADIGYFEDIQETGVTLKENASIKSQTIFRVFNVDCFSDDTGLEVYSLDGRPGVYSARYAGKDATYESNVDKLLHDMKDIQNRSAAFSTVISLIIDGNEYFFEGRVEGEITFSRTGIGGFGYDPVFKPNGYNETFAEMSPETKSKISHRALATAKLIGFLNEVDYNL